MSWSCPFFNKAANKGLRAIESSGKGLYAEITFRPYWNAGFHLCALATIGTHILRCMNNLWLMANTILTTALLIFTPWNLPYIPIVLVEHALAATVSVATAALVPVFFVFRTLFSMVLGYQADNECLTWDSSLKEEQDYWQDATIIFIPS